MKRYDGGPAFPVSDAFVDSHEGGHGMTLRDWFAGQALDGLLAGDWMSGPSQAPSTYARAAYKMADAMLAARRKG